MNCWRATRRSSPPSKLPIPRSLGPPRHSRVDVSIDFGATWQRVNLEKPKNKFDWQRWTWTLKLPSDGYFEIWTRGTDTKRNMQPHQAGFWNPQGYGGNAMHRVAVLVA